MLDPLEELLRERFAALGVKPSRAAWARHFDNLDKATLTRIFQREMTLTPKRAEQWAKLLFPSNGAEAIDFAGKLTAAWGQRDKPPLTVREICDGIIARGGAVPAEEIIHLLEALQSPGIHKVLICCEYRDVPQSGPDSSHEFLSEHVGKAIAKGVSFAMFQPFGETIPLPADGNPNSPAFNAAIYMMKIRSKCIGTYKLFQKIAVDAISGDDSNERPQQLNILELNDGKIICETYEIDKLVEKIGQDRNYETTKFDLIIRSRLQLYHRSNVGESYLGSGFQGRMFYIRYTTKVDERNHERIFQWISAPKNDLLIYRGEVDIDPNALKDSFYPIPHFFDSTVARLPLKLDDSDHNGPGVRAFLKGLPGGEELPVVSSGDNKAKSIWACHD